MSTMLSDGEVSYVDRFLGDAAISKHCAETWSKTCNIKRIILRGNCISEVGAQALIPIIQKNAELSYISLEWNQLGSGGVIALSGVLETTKHMVTLDLKNNNIGDEGAIALAVCLERNESIKTLDLRWNQIGDRGMESFRRILERRRKNILLLYQGNPISLSLSNQMERWACDEIDVTASTESIGGADENVRPTKNINLNPVVNEVVLSPQDFKDMREETKAVEAEKDDLLRQLDASAIRITDLEQAFIREQHKSTRLGEEVTLHQRRLAEQANEYRKLTEKWEIERSTLMKENNDKIVELNEDLKKAQQDKEAYKERMRKAEEDKKYIDMQLEQISKQSEISQQDMQGEITKLTAQLSETSINEARLKSELFSTSSSLERVNTRVETLQEEFTKYRTETGKSHHDEINQLTLDFNAREEVLKTDNAKLSATVHTQNSTLTDLKAKLATSEIESQRNQDKAVACAVENEQQKNEKTISDLTMRIDAFLKTRDELQDRCDDYVKEIRSIKEDNSIIVTGLTEQNKSLQEELSHLRSKCATQREELSDYQDAKKRLSESNRIVDDLKLSLDEAIKERKSYSTKVNDLELQLQEAIQGRNNDFNNISNRISEAIRSELENIKATISHSTHATIGGQGSGSKSPSRR